MFLSVYTHTHVHKHAYKHTPGADALQTTVKVLEKRIESSSSSERRLSFPQQETTTDTEANKSFLSSLNNQQVRAMCVHV